MGATSLCSGFRCQEDASAGRAGRPREKEEVRKRQKRITRGRLSM